MSNSQKESMTEKLTRMKRETEAAKAASSTDEKVINQLTHESDGEPDFAEIARKLQERKEQQDTGSKNAGYVKLTIYIEENLAQSFQALCTKRGDQKEYANQALADFVAKKVRELGM